LIDNKSLSRGELDNEINSSFTENIYEELYKEKYVSRAELDNDTKPSLVEKPCVVLLIIKQKDQNIKQLHTEQRKKNTIKSESVFWAINLCPSSSKKYLDLGSLLLRNCTFILKCFVYIPSVLLLSCFCIMVFDLGR